MKARDERIKERSSPEPRRAGNGAETCTGL